jgi:branched-chain amino acid transport system substrate-binding protein
MRSTGRRAFVALAGLVLLAATACGQYPNVHIQGADSGLNTSASSPGAAAGSASGTPASPGALSGGSTGGSTTGSGSTSSGGSTSAGSGSGSVAPPPSGKGDTTGVTASTITIGIHAPVTGAAPVPVNSFAQGVNLYWDHGNNGKPVLINGRRVHAVFEDDHYDPSVAVTACRKMAEQEHAFLLIGGAGTDQIQACAQWAATQGIPYLSAGVTMVGLSNLPNYFALSMTYPDQAVLLVNYIKHVLHVTDGKKVAMVAEDSSNFDDAVAAFQKAFPGVTVFRPGKNDNGSSMAANLCTGTVKNFQVVFPLVAPVYYLEMAKAANCDPQYAGVGLTEGIDTVASAGCAANNSTLGAQFFNPSPAWQGHASFDKGYDTAIKAAGKNFPNDDIVWLLWGLMKDVGSLLQQAGKNLTRQGFIYSTEHATVHTGVYPDLRYSSGNHFGARQVHVLKNVCQPRGNTSGYYQTLYAFKSAF